MSDVYVSYDPAGRMGNRMFQFAFGYILANARNCQLYHESLPNFNIEGKYGPPVDNITTTRSMGNHKVDFNKLISDPNTIIVSFLQRAGYFKKHRDSLREAFKIKKHGPINKDNLVVHVRETDYNQINCFLGYEFYKAMIDSSGFTNVRIVTDNSNCDTVQKLLADGCDLVSEGYVDKFQLHSNERSFSDWLVLLLSENIALSQSSFSWWAAFLGTHNKVIFPFSEKANMWPINPGGDTPDPFFDLDKTNTKFIY